MNAPASRPPLSDSCSLALAAALGALLLCPVAALAYVPPAHFLLQKMAASRASFRSLRVRQATTRLQDGRTTKVTETVYISVPGRVRIEERDSKGKLLRVVLRTGWKQSVWRGGRRVGGGKVPLPRLDLLAVGRYGLGTTGIKGLLKALGVRYTRTLAPMFRSDYRIQPDVSLALHGRRPAVVFGAPSGNRKRSQIWIDKGRWHPVRFIGKVRQGGREVSCEVRFWDYLRTVRGYSFPGRTEVIHDGAVVLRSAVHGVRLSPRLRRGLFVRP